MSDDEPGKRKAAGIVGILVGFPALVNLICGFIYVGLVGGADASGIWSGIGLLIIAILGIVLLKKPNKGVFVSYLVFNILCLIIDIVQVIVALIALLVWVIIDQVVQSKCGQVGDKCICNADEALPSEVSDCDNIAIVVSCIVAIVISSAIAVILTFAGSIIGCMGVCCARPQTNVVVVQQPGVVMTTTTTSHQQEAPPEYPAKY